jgi:hypothetical protein
MIDNTQGTQWMEVDEGNSVKSCKHVRIPLMISAYLPSDLVYRV